MRTKRSLLLLLTFSLLLFTPTPIKGSYFSRANTTTTSTAEFFPVSPMEYHPMDVGIGVGGAPFQLCLDCQCCSAADPSDCSSMSCCFGIDCNLPDKPFGVCAFRPKVCNCTACN